MGSWGRVTGNGALYSGETLICPGHYEITIDREADGSFLAKGHFDAGSRSFQEFLTDLNLRLASGEHVRLRIVDVRMNSQLDFRIGDPVSTAACVRLFASAFMQRSRDSATAHKAR